MKKSTVYIIIGTVFCVVGAIGVDASTSDTEGLAWLGLVFVGMYCSFHSAKLNQKQ